LSSSETMRARNPGTGPGLRPWRRPVLALALALTLAVLLFAALYPYLEATGSCGDPGCPEFSHAHAPAPSELPPGALVAVLAAAPVLAGGFRFRPASDRRPAEFYLSPDPEPPRP
jgi:hypothetical protein